MPLSSFEDIGEKKPLNPETEMSRLNYVEKQRKLFNGNFIELALDPISTQIPGISTNWFRRIATFYPEFMFSELPEVSIENNERFTQYLRGLLPSFLKELQFANVNMLRFGQGVVCTNPFDPLYFMHVDTDYHYEVQKTSGEIVGDIIINIRNKTTSNAIIDIIKYPIEGKATWDIHRYEGNNVGPKIASIEIPDRSGRQVVTFYSTIDKTSIFDDMKPHVSAMSRNLTNLGKTLRRNSRPHLYAPDSSIQTDENGNAVVNVDGMFIPMQEGDRPPGYLQWDSNIEAAQWDYDKNEQLALIMAGLNSAIFAPDMKTGVVSGIALRRVLLPFVSKLYHYTNANNTALVEMLNIHNNNRRTAGQEVFSFEAIQVLIKWAFEKLFSEVAEEDRAQQTPAGKGKNKNKDKNKENKDGNQ